jgi:thiol-disulfide isomerase/thioredoxin
MAMKQHSAFVIAAALSVTAAVVLAQSPAQAALARGKALWDQRLANSAVASLETAAKEPSTAAEAHEALGRIYTFKGWQQESAFPGWHDEPTFRERAIAELKASVKADPNRASAQEALKTAEGFAAAENVDPAPPRPEIKALDAALQAAATPAAIAAAVDARAKAQADPAPYFTGAQLLIDRGDYNKAITLAERGAAVSDRFVDENLSAYQMSGKSQGSKTRGHATAVDLVGWAQFMNKNYAAAAEKLGEAERLSQGQDFVNQFHMGELARAQNVPARAKDHYLDALSLAGGPAPLRQKAKETLASMQAGGEGSGGVDAWLEKELARRRDDRKAAMLKSLVDRPLPKLALTTVDGKPFDASTLRGKVVLLDFFASWCGICRAELPQLKTAYAKYQNDPKVAFILVSIDEDDKRLQRYLTEMKFPFPVARLDAAQAEKAMGFDNVPQTFYVDAGGVVRYQLNGSESHGDSVGRVGWYIDQLKQSTK